MKHLAPIFLVGVIGLAIHSANLSAQLDESSSDQAEISLQTQAGRDALEEGKFKQAIRAYSKVANLSKGESVEAYVGLAAASLRLERYQDACKYAEKAAERAVTRFDRSVAFNILGLAHWEIALQEEESSPDREENLQVAESSFRKALEASDEELAVAWSNLALVLEIQDRLSDAEIALEAYLAREPENRQAWSRLCWVTFLRNSTLKTSAEKEGLWVGGEHARVPPEGAQHADTSQEAGGSRSSTFKEGDLSPMKIEGDVLPPKKVYSAQPLYTEEARQARIQGIVILEAVINKYGTVQDVQILKGLPHGLSESAVRTACKWEFEPATLHSDPVAVYFNVTIRFSFGKRSK